jgi:Uma2 family endonuclease
MVVRIPQSDPLTVDDIYDPPDDGHRYELIDGCLIVTPSPSMAHQLAAARLFRLLLAALTGDLVAFFAPFDWIVGPNTKLQPDLLVFHRRDVDADALRKPPVLAVEILSPSTRRLDLGTKRLAVAGGGAAHYWIVDPLEPSITVFDLAGDDFEEVGHAVGDQELRLETPFSIVVVPSQLLA